jgi:hypothetical protein
MMNGFEMILSCIDRRWFVLFYWSPLIWIYFACYCLNSKHLQHVSVIQMKMFVWISRTAKPFVIRLYSDVGAFINKTIFFSGNGIIFLNDLQQGDAWNYQRVIYYSYRRVIYYSYRNGIYSWWHKDVQIGNKSPTGLIGHQNISNKYH